MPVATMAILWIFIFSNNMGIFNALFKLIGKEEWMRPWLGNSKTVLPSLAVPLVWAGIGLFMLMFMGAIGNISTSIYEAVKLDGATRWQQFIYITIPLIWPQIKASIIYIIITTLNGSYVLVTLMTQGGPNNASQVMGSYLYQQAFIHYNFGFGATIGVMILTLTLFTVLVMQLLLKRERIEY
jgi:N-acetylglucosamine transport system permease protein